MSCVRVTESNFFSISLEFPLILMPKLSMIGSWFFMWLCHLTQLNEYLRYNGALWYFPESHFISIWCEDYLYFYFLIPREYFAPCFNFQSNTGTRILLKSGTNLEKLRLEHQIIFPREEEGGAEVRKIHTNPERWENFKFPFLYLKTIFLYWDISVTQRNQVS